MISEHIEKAMKKIEGWWQGELIDDRPCIGFVLPKPLKSQINKGSLNLACSLIWDRKNWGPIYSLLRSYFKSNPEKFSANFKDRQTLRLNPMVSLIYSYFNRLWPHPAEGEVDIEKFVEREIDALHSVMFFGEEIPRILHQYGARGAPLTMAAYLGAELEFLDDTILKKPIIDNWGQFELNIKPSNIWYEYSLKLMEIAAQKSKGEFLVDIPDLGDVYTNLYQLRGPMIFEETGFEPKLLQARDKFFDLWIEAYEDFWKITSQKFPGTSHWLCWAPGKSYACQCDASCIAISCLKKEVASFILTRIVEDFIVPEMEKLGKYLDYIIWHLDGQEELEFLDVLLDLPQIKAIQWRPNFGSHADAQWLPLFQKIQKAKKSLWVMAENEKEVEALIENLSPERLYIRGGFTGRTEKEAREFLKRVEDLTRKRIKSRSFQGI